MTNGNQPTSTELKDAILRSGYLLETRVEELLRKEWGFVEANSVYVDPFTNKTRELDIFSLRADKAGPDSFDYLFTSLLIECVNNPYPLICFTKEPLTGFLQHYNIKMAGLPTKILESATLKKKNVELREKNKDKNIWKGLSDYLEMDKYHHYCKGKIATQYCSVAPKKSGNKQEWFALHEGNHFDSFRKLCDATEYNIKKHYANWIFINGKEKLNLTFYYPILVIQGELLEAIPSARSVSLRKSQHIQFQFSDIINGRESVYHIDIIQEKYLQTFLKLIEKEIMQTVRLLRRRHKIVHESINKIIDIAKKEESPEKVRSAFEFNN